MEIGEIELGEYIRTKNGYIIKYQDNVNTNIFSMDDDLYVENPLFPDEEKIVKHSKNIIDLIEEGDYVNGEYVSKVMKNYITIGRITYNREELRY
jgi:hypothetical protein